MASFSVKSSKLLCEPPCVAHSAVVGACVAALAVTCSLSGAPGLTRLPDRGIVLGVDKTGCKVGL